MLASSAPRQSGRTSVASVPPRARRSSARTSSTTSTSRPYPSGPSPMRRSNPSSSTSASHLAVVGDAAPVDTATVTGPLRRTAGKVRSPRVPSPARLTSAPAACAAASASASTSGEPVATTTTRAPATSAASKGRRCTSTRPSASSGSRDGSTRGATTVTCAPASTRVRARRAPTGPAPTTTHRCPATRSCTGSPPSRPTVPCSPLPSTPSACRAALLVEGQDLQLDRHVHVAHQHVRGHVQHGRREVEDRADARLDQALGGVLRRPRRGGDDPDHDPVLADEVAEAVLVVDDAVADLLADLLLVDVHDGDDGETPIGEAGELRERGAEVARADDDAGPVVVEPELAADLDEQLLDL